MLRRLRQGLNNHYVGFDIRSDETIPEKYIERLARYLRLQGQKLMHAPLRDVLAADFEWDVPSEYENAS